MVVLGVVLPAVMDGPDLRLTAADGTQISTARLFGLMIGALPPAGCWTIIGSVFSFSVLTFFLRFVDQLGLFILLRFLAGRSLDGCTPASIPMVIEFRGRERAGASPTEPPTGPTPSHRHPLVRALGGSSSLGW